MESGNENLSILSNPDDDDLQLNSPAVSNKPKSADPVRVSSGKSGKKSTDENKDNTTDKPSPVADTTIRIPQPTVQFPFVVNSQSLLDTSGSAVAFENSVIAGSNTKSNINNDMIRELEAKLLKHATDFGSTRPFVHPASGANRDRDRQQTEATTLERSISHSGLNQNEKDLLKEIQNEMWAPFGSESLQEKERRVNKECKNYNGLTDEERRMVVSGFKAFDGVKTTKIVARPRSKVPTVAVKYTTQSSSLLDDDTSQGSVRSLEDQVNDITSIYLRPATHVSNSL